MVCCVSKQKKHSRLKLFFHVYQLWILFVGCIFQQKDLIHTIGESAALGAAGFVIWGDLNLTSSKVGVLCSRTLSVIL